MKTEKLPNGYYRVRQQYKGKRYSINFDHKPSAREINLAFSEKMALNDEAPAPNGTLEFYADKYIDKLRREKKSPTTINGYSSIKKNTPHWFLCTDLQKLIPDDVKRAVSEYGETRAPKTTKSFYSFWKCVIESYRPYIKLMVKLPSTQKKHEYHPTTKDIARILEYASDSRYYVALRLASMGLRRGETCALSSADLNEDNLLTINKDMVVDENHKQIIKHTPKTDASNRRILIPSDVADLIRQNGVAFSGNMHTINEYLHKCQDTLDIPRFRLHVLRHFAAAYLLKNGFNSIQIEDYMGWEHGSSVMQKVYAYNLDPHESQQDIASVFSKL